MNESEKNQRQAALALLLSIAGLALLFNPNRLTSAKDQIASYSEFVAEVRAGHLAEVKIPEKELVGQLKEEAAMARGGNRQITTTRSPNMDDPALLKDLECLRCQRYPNKSLSFLARSTLPSQVSRGIFSNRPMQYIGS